MNPKEPLMKASSPLDRFHREEHPHLFREILRTQQVFVETFSRAAGMPAAPVALLRQIALGGEPEVGVGELARSLGVTPALITRQVKDLEEGGWLARRADPRDGRRSYLRLTPKGQKAFLILHERAHQIESAILNGIDTQAIETTCQVLAAVRTALETGRFAAIGPEGLE